MGVPVLRQPESAWSAIGAIVRSVCAPPLSRDSNHRFRIHKLEFGIIGTRLDHVGQYWTRRGPRSVMLEEVMIAYV